MELRVLQYFLAVAREENISAAAKALHISQPTLSRQIQSMEEELGKQLLIRGTKGSRKLVLTEEGMILRKRAEEILDLVQKTENEIILPDTTITGDVFIGAAETDTFRIIGKIAKKLQDEYPDIHYDIFSSNRGIIMEKLDKGLIDFAIVYGSVDFNKYDFLKIPHQDSWGILMKKDSPLAKKEAISPEDLWDKPLIMSKQIDTLSKWLKKDPNKLNIVVSFNLIYNAAILTSEGFGYTFTLTPPTAQHDDLCFRPLLPEIKEELNIVWKKYQTFSKAAEKLLAYFYEYLSD